MKRFHLKSQGLELLEVCGNSGLLAYRAVPDVSGTSELQLQLGDGAWVCITPEMHDLEGWEEIGVLMVRACDEPSDCISLGQQWQKPLNLHILAIEDDGWYAESGVVIASNAGELVAVAADMPFSLAVKAPHYEGRFGPEHDLSSYVRVAYGRP